MNEIDQLRATMAATIAAPLMVAASEVAASEVDKHEEVMVRMVAKAAVEVADLIIENVQSTDLRIPRQPPELSKP